MTSSTDLLALVAAKKKQIADSKNRREKLAKLHDGQNIVRILPGWRNGDATFWHDFGEHYVKGMDGKVKAVFLCNEKTHGKPCSVCDGIGRAIASSSDDAVNKILADAKSNNRVLVNVQLPQDSDPAKRHVAQLLGLPPTVFGNILEMIDTWGNIIDPVNGRAVIITKTGSGLETKYAVLPHPEVSAVPESVMKSIKNLDDYVREEGEESVRRALTALNATAGLLPPPAAAAADRPTTPPPAYGAATIDGTMEVDLAPAAAPVAPATVAGSAPASNLAASVSADEMDDLLKDLEG